MSQRIESRVSQATLRGCFQILGALKLEHIGYWLDSVFSVLGGNSRPLSSRVVVCSTDIAFGFVDIIISQRRKTVGFSWPSPITI